MRRLVDTDPPPNTFPACADGVLSVAEANRRANFAREEPPRSSVRRLSWGDEEQIQALAFRPQQLGSSSRRRYCRPRRLRPRQPAVRALLLHGPLDGRKARRVRCDAQKTVVALS